MQHPAHQQAADGRGGLGGHPHQPRQPVLLNKLTCQSHSRPGTDHSDMVRVSALLCRPPSSMSHGWTNRTAPRSSAVCRAEISHTWFYNSFSFSHFVDRVELLIVEVPLPHVGADLKAGESELAHCPLHLCRGQCGSILWLVRINSAYVKGLLYYLPWEECRARRSGPVCWPRWPPGRCLQCGRGRPCPPAWPSS